MTYTVRILKVPGRSDRQREAFLVETRDWMKRYGWRLDNYSIPDATAMFVLDEKASVPKFFHRTRWLPGPGLWKPHRLLHYWWLRPGAMLLPVGLLAFLIVTVWLVNFPPEFVERAGGLAGQNGLKHGERWMMVEASSLNVRETPNPDSRAVGILYRNQRVLVEREEKGWAQLGKPERGFVSLRYLKAPPVAGQSGAPGGAETSEETATQ